MRPKRIILIRHGESSANVDRYLFGQIPDYTIELTEKGCMQARVAGCKLKELVGDESIYFYVSPFWRTRSTFENIVRSIPRSQFVYSEEPRLREQEWGYLRCNEDFDKICRERREYGTFYYRIPGGESGTDVYDRIDDLLAKYAQEEKYCWAIEEKESKKLIGSIDLFDVASGEKEIGYLLNKEYWNNNQSYPIWDNSEYNNY